MLNVLLFHVFSPSLGIIYSYRGLVGNKGVESMGTMQGLHSLAHYEPQEAIAECPIPLSIIFST